VRCREVVFEGRGRVAIRRTEVGEPGAEEVLVRTAFSGISPGTELLAYLGKLDPDLPLDEALPGGRAATFRYPFSYGYSCVGEVQDASERPTAVFAFRPHVDAFVARPSELIPLSAWPEPRATLFPLVETALQICVEVDLGEGGQVLVVGLGAVGTLVALLLAERGLEALAVEPRADRRRLAHDLGLRAIPPEDAPGAVDAWTGGRGVPRAVEASGSPAALAATLPLLAHEGQVVVASWYGTDPVPLPLGGAFHRRRLTIRSTQVSTIPERLRPAWTVERRREEALRLCAELPLDRIPSLVLPVEKVGDAFAILAAGREGGPMHVVLDHR
jgi:2-desacetyl-2-hydroxyethyl bacteriochlorophyllide A dehydrogenase